MRCWSLKFNEIYDLAIVTRLELIVHREQALKIQIRAPRQSLYSTAIIRWRESLIRCEKTPTLSSVYLSNQRNKNDRPSTGQSSDALNRRHLVLIPTEFERQLAAPMIDALLQLSTDVHICGIGMIESAIQTLQLGHRLRPHQVWLVGIAGSYVEELVVGQAYEFSQVCCYGIGVGAAGHFQTIDELGWSASLGTGVPERIQLNSSATFRSLLSTTSASANIDEARMKLLKFPDCQAEDMEAFAVARACQSMNIPLRVIRGISNRAGDREHQGWKAADAMRSAIAMVRQQMEEFDAY